MHPNVHSSFFPVDKIWKHSKYSPTDEWIKRMWYIYSMKCYSVIKKNGIMPFVVTWMDLEINQSEETILNTSQ